jgi:hypothetical protein
MHDVPAASSSSDPPLPEVKDKGDTRRRYCLNNFYLVVEGDLCVELALPLRDFGVGQAEFVLRFRTSHRLLVEGSANRVQLELDLEETWVR